MDQHSIAAYLEYLGASVPVIGHGWRKIKCPFHDDGHASAGINFEEQRFKCHGCGVGGDVYDLIMYKEGGNYREAVQFAEAISPAGNTRVHKKHTHGSGISSDSRLIGRRGAAVSYRSSQGLSSRS